MSESGVGVFKQTVRGYRCSLGSFESDLNVIPAVALEFRIIASSVVKMLVKN